jgi:hypothetical protein
VTRALSDAVDASGAVHGFVAEHDWVQSLLERTPWERAAGVEPARTVDALVRLGRVDPDRALRVVGPGMLRETAGSAGASHPSEGWNHPCND